MSTRRVLLVTTGLQRGGAEAQFRRLCEHLASRGFDLLVMTLISGGVHHDALTARGIKVESLHWERRRPTIRGFLRAVAAAVRYGPAVIVSFQYHGNVVARCLKVACPRARLVASIRNEQFGGLLREVTLRATRCLVWRTVVNSRRVARTLVQRNIVAEDEVVVIPNVVTQRLTVAGGRVETRAALGVAVEEFVWLAVGRLEPQKDYHTLIDACRELRGTRPWRLLIVGAGSERDAIANAMNQDQQLIEKVHLLGERSDVPALMAAADGLVLASAWEGTPNVVLEALVAGLPIVATDVGGVGEYLRDGVEGFLAPPRAASRLAAAMRNLMELGEQELRCMGQRGRARSLEVLDEAACLAKWEAAIAAR